MLRRLPVLLLCAHVTAFALSPANIRGIFSVPPRVTSNFVSRASVPHLCQGDAKIDTCIDELLAEAKPEALPALLGRRLDVLTDGRFLARLEERRAATTIEYEQLQLEQLADLVVTFLEQLTERVKELEPELQAAESEADESIAEIAKAADEARRAVSSAPPRRARSSMPIADSPSAGDAASSANTVKEGDEQKAKYRFLLERLLDAASAGVDRLDKLLAENRDKLDAGFFAHLQWEMDEQKKMKNRNLLGILEVVVQRACVEVESGQPEVALLSSLLQTPNQSVRMELYQRSLLPEGVAVQRAFVALVTDTQLTLEKKIFRGEQVDPSLLQTLRIILAEVADLNLKLEPQ